MKKSYTFQVKVWQKALGWIALWRIGLLLLAAGAIRFIPFVKTFTPSDWFGKSLPYLVWIWGNFDGMVFMLIAQSGYSAEQLPFFPLLPLFVWAGYTLFGLPQVVAGLIVTTIAFFVAQYYIFQLLKLDKKTTLYWFFLMIMLLFPTSFFYTAVYADSLFLALASGSLFYSRKRKWLIASVFAAIATLARLNGLALLFVIGAEYLLSVNTRLEKQWDFVGLIQTFWNQLISLKIFRSGIIWAFLVPAAFLGYLAYIQITFGDWHLFFSGVEVWHRDKLTFPLQTFWRYVKILIIYPNLTFTYVIAALEALFTLLYFGALAWSWGKIRISYWLMIFMHLLIPTLTGTLQGMPRYGLHLYPLFLIYALFLREKPRWVKGIWFMTSVGLLVFYVAYYTRGYFVA